MQQGTRASLQAMLACAERLCDGYASRLVAEYTDHVRRFMDEGNPHAAWVYARAALRAARERRRRRRLLKGSWAHVN